jgi:hypothetical protein
MTRTISPYHALPFYAVRSGADGECPILSPTKALPMFQLTLPGTLSAVGWAAYLENEGGTYSQGIPGMEREIVTNGSDTFTIFTYTATALSSAAPEGDYRIRFDIPGQNPYYSHPLCLARKFNEQDWEPVITCNAGTFTVAFDDPPGLPTEVEVSFDGGYYWQRIGTGGTGTTFPQASTIDGECHIRLTVWLDEANFYREFLYEFDELAPDPCATDTISPVGSGGDGYGRFLCIEWANVSDLMNLGLYYNTSGPFRQQWYCEGYISQPTTVKEQEFLETGTGAKILDSSRVARLQTVEFYGIPDAAIAGLSLLEEHAVKQIRETVDDWTVQGQSAAMTFQTPDNAACAVGQLAIELDRVLVGCQENFETV